MVKHYKGCLGEFDYDDNVFEEYHTQGKSNRVLLRLSSSFLGGVLDLPDGCRSCYGEYSNLFGK